VAESRDLNLDPELFTARVTSLTHSFGDETRRKIYLFLREHPSTTVNHLAEHTGVHANVVRHHLDKLTEGGFVVAHSIRSSGVGRPAKVYSVTTHEVAVESSLRRDALLVALLEMALDRLGPEASELLAHDVGIEYGKNLAIAIGGDDSQRSVADAMTQIASLLTAHGFNARSEGDAQQTAVVADNCPFGSAAQHHPVLCAVDRGLIGGMLEGLGAARTTVTLKSRARGDDDCRVTA
jgi:predicted ArsR family transcriptional regulator